MLDSPPSLPSISDDEDIESRWNVNIVEHLLQSRLMLLNKERQALNDGVHPKFLEEIELAERAYELRLEQITAMEQEETGRIEREYAEQICLEDQRYEQKLRELEETMNSEQEEQQQQQKRSLDGEISGSDNPNQSGGELSSAHQHSGSGSVVSQQQNQSTTFSSKKYLRRRPNDFGMSTNGIESHHSNIDSGVSIGVKRRNLAKKGGPPFVPVGASGFSGSVFSSGLTVPTGLFVPHLLSEASIAEDVSLLSNDTAHAHRIDTGSGGMGPEGGGGSGNGGTEALLVGLGCSSGGEMADEEGAASERIRHHRRVALEQSRLVLDGKTFHRFQPVYIDLKSGSKIPAIIRSISENRYVEFRSAITGDTRQITATKADLESGQVFVRKRY